MTCSFYGGDKIDTPTYASLILQLEKKCFLLPKSNFIKFGKHETELVILLYTPIGVQSKSISSLIVWITLHSFTVSPKFGVCWGNILHSNWSAISFLLIVPILSYHPNWMKWNYRSHIFLKSRFGNFTRGNICTPIGVQFPDDICQVHMDPTSVPMSTVVKMPVQGDSLDLWERDYSTICRLDRCMAFLAEA